MYIHMAHVCCCIICTLYMNILFCSVNKFPVKCWFDKFTSTRHVRVQGMYEYIRLACTLYNVHMYFKNIYMYMSSVFKSCFHNECIHLSCHCTLYIINDNIYLCKIVQYIHCARSNEELRQGWRKGEYLSIFFTIYRYLSIFLIIY